MRDYSDGQFEDRAIVASKKQRGKYCIAKVQRISANEVEVLRRCDPMTLKQAKLWLEAGYDTHSAVYLKDGQYVHTMVWCLDLDECRLFLQGIYKDAVKLLKFDDTEVSN